MKTFILFLTTLFLFSASPSGAESLHQLYTISNSGCKISFGEEITPGIGVAMMTCRSFNVSGWSDTTDFMLYRFDGFSLSVTVGSGESKAEYFFIVAANGSLHIIDPSLPVLEPVISLEVEEE